jgi:hypothetical protein
LIAGERLRVAIALSGACVLRAAQVAEPGPDCPFLTSGPASAKRQGNLKRVAGFVVWTRFAVPGRAAFRVRSFRAWGVDLGHVSTRKLHDRGVPVIDRAWTGQHRCTGRLRVDQCFGKFLDFVTSKLVPIRIG